MAARRISVRTIRFEFPRCSSPDASGEKEAPDRLPAQAPREAVMAKATMATGGRSLS